MLIIYFNYSNSTDKDEYRKGTYTQTNSPYGLIVESKSNGNEFRTFYPYTSIVKVFERVE